MGTSEVTTPHANNQNSGQFELTKDGKSPQAIAILSTKMENATIFEEKVSNMPHIDLDNLNKSGDKMKSLNTAKLNSSNSDRNTPMMLIKDNAHAIKDDQYSNN